MTKPTMAMHYSDGNTTIWTTPSSSRPHISHKTTRYPDGTVNCECEGWKHHGKCWHTAQVMPPETDEGEGFFQVSL